MPNFAFLYQQARFSGYSVEGGGGTGGSGGAARRDGDGAGGSDRRKHMSEKIKGLAEIKCKSQSGSQTADLGPWNKKNIVSRASWQGNCSARSFKSLRMQLSAQVTEDFALGFTRAPPGPRGKSPTCHDLPLNPMDRSNLIKMDISEFEFHASSSCCNVKKDTRCMDA